MDDVDRRSVLGAMPLFADTLDGAAIDRLASESTLAFFPAGSYLMSEGEFGASMFAIVEGSATVTLHDADGLAHTIADLGPREIVGEIAVMTGQRRSATVVAKTDVIAIEIPKFALEETFARAPEFIDRIGAVLAGRQARLRRVEADAASGPSIATQIRRFFARPRR